MVQLPYRKIERNDVMFQKLMDELINAFPTEKWESQTVHISYYDTHFDTKYFFENKTLGYTLIFNRRRNQHIYELVYSYKTRIDLVKPILFSCLKREGYDLLFYELTDRKPVFYAFGKKSKLLKQVIEGLGSVSFSRKGHLFWNHCRFPYIVDIFYLYGECCIKKRIKNEMLDEYTIQNVEHVQSFFTMIENEKQELIQKEQVFLPFIQIYDTTAYFKEESQTYYIFGKGHKIYLKKEVFGYTGYVNREMIKDHRLDNIIEKMKKTIQQLIVKNRTKAVLEGKTLQFIPRFLHHILEKRVSCYRYERHVDSSFTEEELNTWLKDHITICQKKALPKEELLLIQTFFKEKLNKRHQLKIGFRYGELFVLVSGTKVHVLKPEEIKKEAS